MYSPKIDEEQVRRLYQLKLAKLAEGEGRVTLVMLVKVALERFLEAEEEKIETERILTQPAVDART